MASTCPFVALACESCAFERSQVLLWKFNLSGPPFITAGFRAQFSQLPQMPDLLFVSVLWVNCRRLMDKNEECYEFR